MILHPHIEQMYVAIEVLRRVASIMKTWGLQPPMVKRYIENYSEDSLDDLEDGSRNQEFGYLHEIRSDNSDLDISWSLCSVSEFEPLIVRVELSFGDNPEHVDSSDFCLEYNSARNEWIASYDNQVPEDEPKQPSKLATKFVKKYNMKLDDHRVLNTQEAWSAIRDMAEFYSKHSKANI